MKVDEMTDLVNRYATARRERLVSQKVTDSLKKVEEECKAAIIAEVSGTTTDTVGGTGCFVKINRSHEPVIEDWLLVKSHIIATDEFDILQKRLNGRGIKARWEDGLVIPGVGPWETINLSLNSL